MARRKILVADLLCGAGGSSTGCERALTDLGLEMELVCVNHWPTAIETHRINHPMARHYVQDISTVRPHQIVPEGYLDLLMASPTCTHHSVARGGKPTSDQQRSDPWHIITWLTELRVKRLIIENVWEFVGWGPVDPRTGRPIPSRKGEYFRAWMEVLRSLNFDPQYKKLNAADYGDATTRSRFILMARSDGRRVLYPAATHVKRPPAGTTPLPSLQTWRPAREIIDWDLKGRSIFNRKKALAPKTLARIYAGAVKFDWPEPFLVILRNHMAAQGLDQPLPTIAAAGQHIGLATPILLKQNFRRDAQDVDEPAPTVMTQARIGLAEAIVLSQHSSGAPRTAADPLPTLTTGGAGSPNRPGCARPMLVTVAHGVDAGERDPHTRRSHDLADPLGAIHGDGSAYAVIEPFVLSQGAGGVPRGVTDPVPTIPSHGAHALISPYYGSGSGETCTEAGDPLPTVTSRARFGMVVPVTNKNGGALARSVEDPVPTMTTAKGGEFAVVMPVTHADVSDRVRDTAEPLPTVTGAHRGELAFVTAQFGEAAGQAPRTHDLADPAPTGLTLGRGGLVEGLDGYDILFRMLEPHELAAAMGFTSEDQTYEFAGTKTDQIKQIGNAVAVSMMKACVGAMMADAVPRTSRRADAALVQDAA